MKKPTKRQIQLLIPHLEAGHETWTPEPGGEGSVLWVDLCKAYLALMEENEQARELFNFLARSIKNARIGYLRNDRDVDFIVGILENAELKIHAFLDEKQEKADEEDDSYAEYHPDPVLREPAPPRPRPDDDDGFIEREDGAYEWDGSEPD